MVSTQSLFSLSSFRGRRRLGRGGALTGNAPLSGSLLARSSRGDRVHSPLSELQMATNASKDYQIRTLWLCGTLHAFTHIYHVALMPLYLLIQRDLGLVSVEGATLLLRLMMLATFCRATGWAHWRTG